MSPSEPGFADVLIVLCDEQGWPVASRRTDGNGFYRFSGLTAGHYWVSKADVVGYTSVSSNFVAVVVGSQDQTVNFAEIGLLPGCPHAVHGRVWADLDQDGQRAPAEPGVAQAVVRLYALDGTLAGALLSDPTGAYGFEVLEGGPYHLVVEPTEALPESSTPRFWGVDLGGCYVAQIQVGLHAQPAVPRERRDAALSPGEPEEIPSQLRGKLYVSDGHPSSGSSLGAAVAGVRLTLMDQEGHVVAEQLSDTAGNFAFEGLGWQTYYLLQSPLPGYTSQTSRYWGVAPTTACQIQIDLPQVADPGLAGPGCLIPWVQSSP